MVIGDFNNVLYSEENLGGLMVRNSDIKDFGDCVQELNLVEMAYSGNKFTWMSPSVRCKLDRVMINTAWLRGNFGAKTEFIAPESISDHSLGVVSFANTIVKQPKPFKFFNMWTLSDNFLEVVKKYWVFPGGGTKQFMLKEKLGRLKAPLKKLNNVEFGHISSRARIARDNLCAIQNHILNGGIMEDGYSNTRKKAEKLLEAESLFLAQKLRGDYIRQGDRCTKFFYDIIRRNQARNSITCIRNCDGVVVEDPNLIANVFVQHFSNLLEIPGHRMNNDMVALECGQKVAIDSHSDLVAPVTMEEVKEAFFDIDIEKAPGPDGFGSLFFKKCWD
ncbi:uncharacterized protein [Henckelia pumila]|uniref:uncharacterized protein n=1 Tax=Henckelia pumila TaxID=405737 RepID=UPI003C6E8755